MHAGSEIKVERIFDPLLIDVPLTHQETVFPYGFPVIVRTNSHVISRMAVESWSHWKRRFDFEPLEVRCLVNEHLAHEKGSSKKPLPDPTFRAQKNLLTIMADVHNFATCDLNTGFGFGWFSEAAVARRDYFRFHFLDSMVYMLLEMKRVLSVHAACVNRGGTGVLLAGESGAGKSSLSYACAARGWTFISDDASVLVRHLRDRVALGESGRFRFRESAGEIFPEFRGLVANNKRPGNGKPTVEIRTSSLPGIQTAQQSRIDCIVFLKRHSNPMLPVALIPFHDRHAAATRLFEHVWPDDIESYGERLEAVEGLLSTDMYELEYCDLDPAVDALNSLPGRDR